MNGVKASKSIIVAIKIVAKAKNVRWFVFGPANNTNTANPKIEIDKIPNTATMPIILHYFEIISYFFNIEVNKGLARIKLIALVIIALKRNNLRVLFIKMGIVFERKSIVFKRLNRVRVW